ncbi:hypothetical protein ACHAXH_005014 [Discostella pseudostelligera]
MDHDDISTSSLPLGAQQSQSNSNDVEEAQHFQQVIQSYQQYATFHQTRQRGVNRRLINLLLCDEPANVNTNTNTNTDGAGSTTSVHQHPTLESILPPSLQPAGKNTPEYLQYQQDFSAATIRNQYFLDNILKYSNQETSQDAVRRWRNSRQYQQQHQHEQKQKHVCSRTDDDDDDGQMENDIGTIEWTTEDRISKIDSVLKSVARDWSTEGQEERSVVYNKIIGAFERYLPLSRRRRSGDGAREQHHHRPAAGSSSGDVDAASNTEDDQELEDVDDPHGTRKTAATIPTPHRVAVPGSGLGRLAWEIYSRGYSVQGSDFSLPMLLASDFILNGCGGEAEGGDGDGGGRNSFQQFRISPWLAETKNVLSFRDQIRTVIVPDVDPTDIDHSNLDDECELPEFTMLAGEFLHLYSHHLPGKDRLLHHHHPSRHHHHPESTKKFHAVVCSFFIDTAPSLPHYLITIYHMLEEGGLFVHCGPLMYHWSGHGGLLPGDDDIGLSNNNSGNGNAYQERNKHLDSRYLTSIDYTWEEVRYMIVQCGFDILEEEMNIPTHYTMDGRSMMKVCYDCVHCVARKK